MMSGLAEFLLARCDDEQKRASDKWQRPHWGNCNTQGDLSSLGDECDCGLPDRVLAECEARRRIVKIQQTVQREFPGDDAAGMTLRLLAAPYASHAAYDPSWRV